MSSWGYKEMTWDKSFEIKKVYTESPDVDVIELKDGTFICITSETICHYRGELFADDCETITRPDKRKFLGIYSDGSQQNWSVDMIEDIFNSIRRLEQAILLLDLGESLNWNDGTAPALSVVRTR